MSRVQCIECGTAVVVDPSGVCPEGHLVPGAGARIAHAVGGTAPHPAEPQPWVARVILDEDEARPNTSARTVRPVMIADRDDAGHGDGDHEAMLRELHALGDLDQMVASASTPARREPVVGDAPRDAEVPAEPVRAVRTATHDEVADGFAELSALEAAVQSLQLDDRAPDAGPRDVRVAAAPSGEGPALWSGAVAGPSSHLERPDGPQLPVDELREFEALFGAVADEQDRAAGAGDREQDAPVAERAIRRSAAPPPPTAPAPPPGPALRIVRESQPQADAAEVTEPTPAPASEPDRVAEAPLDIGNFTARGERVGGGRSNGRRKLFGR